MNSSFLGIGTNLGSRHENIHVCLSFINAFACVSSLSSIFENPALLPENAPLEWNIPFLNLAAEIKTDLSIFQLLAQLKQIEQKMGRGVVYEKWSPRVIDIDILTYNNLVFITDEITIPHPQIEKREFVLKPMQEINPNGIHPIHGKTFSRLFEELGSDK